MDLGIKLAWLINQAGAVVEWQWLPANVSDQESRDLVQWQGERTAALADSGFRVRADEDDGALIKICERGQWNCRFLIETAYSIVDRVFHAKRLLHRTAKGLDMRLGFMTACFNYLLTLNDGRFSFLPFVI